PGAERIDQAGEGEAGEGSVAGSGLWLLDKPRGQATDLLGELVADQAHSFLALDPSRRGLVDRPCLDGPGHPRHGLDDGLVADDDDAVRSLQHSGIDRLRVLVGHASPDLGDSGSGHGIERCPGGGAGRAHPDVVAGDLAHDGAGHPRLAVVLAADDQDGRLLLDHDLYLCSTVGKTAAELVDTCRDAIAAEQSRHAGGWPTSGVQWTAFMSTTRQQGRASRISTTRLRTLAQWLQIHANVAQLGARGWTRRKRRGRSSSRSSGHRAAGAWASPRRSGARVRPYRLSHDPGTALRRSAGRRRRRGQN